MSEKPENQWVQRPDVPVKLIDLLNENNITTLWQLSKLSKSNLVDLGMTQNDAKK